MEEQWYADRTHLDHLLREHPDWPTSKLVEATGRSESWVKKWRKRLREAPPDDEKILRGRSRARHNPPASIDRAVVERILEIRDKPPGNLQRVPGPKAIIYYLQQDEALKTSGLHLPTSTSTIWRILDRHGRIYRPLPHEHEPLERPEPLVDWGIDFKDISSVPAEPGGKQQHVVECLNVVDSGTSLVLEAVVRDDFNGERAIWAATSVMQRYGRPGVVRFDRDPRFVGSWSGRDFPTPFVRFWLCLGVAVSICPPRRPDKNPFVERYHRNYEHECLAVHRPQDLQEALEVTQAYLQHYNWERPNQAITCGNQPPRQAFPGLPHRPPLPQQVDPDSWLNAIDGKRYTRKVRSNGSVQLDNRDYYVKKQLRGQYVTLRVDARNRQLIVEHNKQPIKHMPIKGLYGEVLDFADYLELIREEARVHWRRMMRQQRRVTM